MIYWTQLKKSEVIFPFPVRIIVFQTDKKTIRAVERNIEIIGEALIRIKKAYPSID